MRLISVLTILIMVASVSGRTQSAEKLEQSGDNPIAGITQVSPALSVRWRYHFDHNALQDARMSGRSLVALTESGNLLCFDAESLRITAQQIVPGGGVSISAGPEQSLIVGTEDGHIYSVDPATLLLKTIYTGRGRVLWVGYGKAANAGNAVVAVLDSTPEVLPRPGEPEMEYASRFTALQKQEVDPLRVLVQANGKSRYFRLTLSGFVTPQTFLLDRGYLWMGVDEGEFGAGYVYMDLRTGNVRSFKSEWGVLGFLRTSDGRLLSYGGTVHITLSRGFIADISKKRARSLQEFNSDEEPAASPEAANRSPDTGKQPDPNIPHSPIDLLIEDGESGFFAVSEHVVYRVNKNFTHWEKYGSLGGRFIGGRRYSVGNTPTVQRIFTRPGTGSLVAVMGRDGIVELVNGNARSIKAQGQMELPIIEIWPTSLGTVFLNNGDLHEGWRLVNQGWEKLQFIPEEKPSGECAQSGSEWWGNSLPVTDDHGIVAYFGDDCSPGQRGFLKVSNQGKPEILSLSSPRNELWYTVIPASGGVFLQAHDRELRSWNGKDWQPAGQNHVVRDVTRMELRTGRSYVGFGVVNGAEMLLDTAMGKFVTLTKTGNEFELRPAGDPAPDGVFDAVPDGDEYVLAATANGLMRFNPQAGKKQSIPVPNDKEEFTSIARDSSGRLWVAGDWLYVSSDEGLHWGVVSLPVLCKTYIKRIRSNGSSGLMITLYERGVVFLEW